MLQVEGVEEAESEGELNEAEAAAAEEQRAMQAAAAAAGATFVDTAGAQQRTEPAGQTALVSNGWGRAMAMAMLATDLPQTFERVNLHAGLHLVCSGRWPATALTCMSIKLLQQL